MTINSRLFPYRRCLLLRDEKKLHNANLYLDITHIPTSPLLLFSFIIPSRSSRSSSSQHSQSDIGRFRYNPKDIFWVSFQKGLQYSRNSIAGSKPSPTTNMSAQYQSDPYGHSRQKSSRSVQYDSPRRQSTRRESRQESRQERHQSTRTSEGTVNSTMSSLSASTHITDGPAYSKKIVVVGDGGCGKTYGI